MLSFRFTLAANGTASATCSTCGKEVHVLVVDTSDGVVMRVSPASVAQHGDDKCITPPQGPE